MRRYGGSFDAFAKGRLDEYLARRMQNALNQINNESEDYLLNVGEAGYVEHLVTEHAVDPLVLRLEEKAVSYREEMIPAEEFPQHRFNVFAGRSYPKQVVRYHIPFSGEAEMLRLTPSTRLMWTTPILVQGEELCFDIVAFSEDDPSPVAKEAGEILGNLGRQAAHVATEVESFNSTLSSSLAQAVAARKKQILARRSLVAGLGVPMRTKLGVPATFAIPTPAVVKRVRPRPEAPPGDYTPEPTLDEDTYAQIVVTIHDIGREMERRPSIYAGKDEEALRDLFLLYLTPRFEAEATGETFNKSGKTDILMRYEGSNIFVAECLVWAGPKNLGEKVDQLLSYLTWRDSKTALMVFVRNVSLSNVLDGIEEALPRHPAFVRAVDRPEESWFNYRLHLPSDTSREVRVAVLVFHLPDS